MSIKPAAIRVLPVLIPLSNIGAARGVIKRIIGYIRKCKLSGRLKISLSITIPLYLKPE